MRVLPGCLAAHLVVEVCAEAGGLGVEQVLGGVGMAELRRFLAAAEAGEKVLLRVVAQCLATTVFLTLTASALLVPLDGLLCRALSLD